MDAAQDYPRLEDEHAGSSASPLPTRTLILESSTNRQIAWLDAAIWPPTGSTVELPHPSPHDAKVIAVRLVIDPPDTPGPRLATIFVDIEFDATG